MAKDYVCVVCGKAKKLAPRGIEFFVLQPEDRVNLKLFASKSSKWRPGFDDVRCKPIHSFSLINKQSCWSCVQKLQGKRHHLAYWVIKELKGNIDWLSRNQKDWHRDLEKMRVELAENQKVLDDMPFIVSVFYGYRQYSVSPYFKTIIHPQKVKPKYYIMPDYTIT